MCGAEYTYRNNKSINIKFFLIFFSMVAEFSVLIVIENLKYRKKWFRNKNVGISNVELL